jgi:NAD+ kinase
MYRIQKIALATRPRLNVEKKIFRELIKFLRKQEKEILFEKNFAEFFSSKKNSRAEILQADLILVFGGDGSLISAVREFYQTKGFFGGVRLSGGLGFLTELAPKNLFQNLTSFFAGKFKTSTRILLTAKIKRNEKIIQSKIALNEITLSQTRLPRLIQLDFFANQKKITNFFADGAIIATPTGSTAYSLSAGGPILFPTLENLILTPISPHLLANRPLVLPADIKITTQIKESNLELVLDGQKSLPLQIGDKIILQKATETIKIIRAQNQNYFSILRKKLNWSERN